MKALILSLTLLLAIALAGCGGGYGNTTIVSPGISYLYAVGQGSNTINGFGVRTDGQLGALAIATFPTSPIPVSMALHTSKNFLYVANSTSNAVSGFALDHTTGDLTPVGAALGPTPVGTNPVSVGVNSGGQFLFVLNQGSTNISVLSIDGTRGLVTQIGGSPFPVPAGPQSMVVSPTAAFLYVSHGASGTISAYSISSSGALTPIAGTTPGGTITGLTIDPKGQFLYAADSAGNQVFAFSVQSSGALTPVGGSPFAAGTQPVAVAVDSTSSFLYSANEGSNDVSAFKISSGALTQVSGSPYATAGSGVVTAAQPVALTVDATNAFLYVANQGSRSIAAFTITATSGALTAVTNAPFGQGIAPTALVSTK